MKCIYRYICLFFCFLPSFVFPQTNSNELITCEFQTITEWRLNNKMQDSTKTFIITNESSKVSFSIICKRCHLTQNLDIKFDLSNLTGSVKSELVIQGLLKVLEVLYAEKQFNRETSIQFQVDKMPVDFKEAFCIEAASQMRKLDPSLVTHQYDEDRTGQIIRRTYQNMPQVKQVTQYLHTKKFKWLIYYDEHPRLAIKTNMKWHDVAVEPNAGLLLKTADGFLTFSPEAYAKD